ncbi:MAG: preprotein translocase subunit SecY [candidate division WOR-3 bacterium]
MTGSVPNIFRIPDLRNKILFTLGMVIVYRLGCHIPVPGINAQALGALLNSPQFRGSVFGLYDIFVGGALGRAAVFSLGIMPYISASIIFQLMGSVFPYLEKLQREEQGRKKINQYTRYLTVGLAVVQSAAIAAYLESQRGSALTGGLDIVTNPGFLFRIITVLTLTAGTILVMWLSERITDKGIGNGASFIIFVGCLDNSPRDIAQSLQMVRSGAMSPFALVVIAAIVVGVYAGVVLITQAVRKIPGQYPKRIVGRRMYGGQSTHVPVRINLAGVMPIIFAQSLIVFPSTVAAFFRGSQSASWIRGILAPGGWVYDLLYAGLIIFFTYFYTSVVFNPQDLADNMQRQGGFVPGIRPGERTAEFIDQIVSRVTVVGALFLVFMALLPTLMMSWLRVPFYFGGTTLLIIVGVALDTVQQIESHLLMRHYEGLLKGSRIKGRRTF